jgi:4-amino-4-deoxy-L-arabinose transferase-like glycosyltransferase
MTESASESAEGRPRKLRWRSLLNRTVLVESCIVVALVAAYLVVQLFFMWQVLGGDTGRYFNAATDIGDASRSHWGLRIGLIFPTAVPVSIFGPSEAGYYFFPLVASSGFLAASYALGRVMFGRFIGITAAVVLAANHYFLGYSSRLFPDIPSGAVLVGAMAVIAYYGLHPERRQAKPLRYQLLLLGAGVLLGWGYLIRETTVLFYPLVPLAWWRLRLPWRDLLYVAGGAFLMFLVELAWGWHAYGDPFTRLKVLVERSFSGRESLVAEEIREARRAMQDNLFESLTIFPRLLLDYGVGSLFLTLAGLLAVGTLVTRDRRLVVLAAWVFGIWLLVCLIGLYETAEEGSILKVSKLRYWHPVLPPLVLGGLAATALLGKRLAGWLRLGSWGRALRVALVGCLAVALVVVGMGDAVASNMPRQESPYPEFRSWLADEGGPFDLIVSPLGRTRRIRIYTRAFWGEQIWEGRVRSISSTEIPAEDFTWEGIVFFDGTRKEPESYFVSVPDHWAVEALFLESTPRAAAFSAGTLERFEVTSTVGSEGGDPWYLFRAVDGALEISSQQGPLTVEALRNEQVYLATSFLEGQGEFMKLRVGLSGTARRLHASCAVSSGGGVSVVPGYIAYRTNARVDVSNATVDLICEVPEADEGPVSVSFVLSFTGGAQMEVSTAQVFTSRLVEASCLGREATIVGTEGNDQVEGTAAADVIVTLGGDDVIDGGGGDDLICAGGGNDQIYGGDGDDSLEGEDGDDRLFAGPGRDVVSGGAGIDLCYGETVADCESG